MYGESCYQHHFFCVFISQITWMRGQVMNKIILLPLPLVILFCSYFHQLKVYIRYFSIRMIPAWYDLGSLCIGIALTVLFYRLFSLPKASEISHIYDCFINGTSSHTHFICSNCSMQFLSLGSSY